MNYWLFQFRPDTFEHVRQYRTVGVREDASRRFSQVKKGDKFVAYLSRVKVFDGYGEVTTDPFQDDLLIFGDDVLYPSRCKVEFSRTGAGKAADDALWGLSMFQGTLATTPSNYIFLKGGFIPLTAQDYEWLVSLLATP